MNFIFSKLPIDIINRILLFDEHFIKRKGKIISVFGKSDYRYKLLKYITFKSYDIEILNGQKTRYSYYLYNEIHTTDYENDLIQVTICQRDEYLEYIVWIGRKKLKNNNDLKNDNDTNNDTKLQIYHIQNPEKYYWKYIEFKYIRN